MSTAQTIVALVSLALFFGTYAIAMAKGANSNKNESPTKRIDPKK